MKNNKETYKMEILYSEHCALTGYYNERPEGNILQYEFLPFIDMEVKDYSKGIDCKETVKVAFGALKLSRMIYVDSLEHAEEVMKQKINEFKLIRAPYLDVLSLNQDDQITFNYWLIQYKDSIIGAITKEAKYGTVKVSLDYDGFKAKYFTVGSFCYNLGDNNPSVNGPNIIMTVKDEEYRIPSSFIVKRGVEHEIVRL